MVQESKSKVAIIGGGPAGCVCAYFLQKDFDVTIFEARSPLATLLPTGGGRCNIAHAEYDFRALAANYPRGEKFLFSVFSKFGTAETVDFFRSIGVDTYVQDDLRIFPLSNSAVDVRDKLLNSLNRVKIIEQRVDSIIEEGSGFSLVCGKYIHKFNKVVIATGGHSGFSLAENLGHKIIPPRPSLCGLKTKENFVDLSGVSFKNITAEVNGKKYSGDFMFTHTGVTGPVIYYISSIMAREKFPYYIYVDFTGDFDFQGVLNENPHKSIKNLLSDYVPKSFAEFILLHNGVNADEKCHKINGLMRDKILKQLRNFEIEAVGTRPDGEVVTSGGVDLKEINPKTMESNIIPGVYFCGEVLDIDGFCGGFNLQNCWSTAFIAAQGIMLSQ